MLPIKTKQTNRITPSPSISDLLLPKMLVLALYVSEHHYIFVLQWNINCIFMSLTKIYRISWGIGTEDSCKMSYLTNKIAK